MAFLLQKLIKIIDWVIYISVTAIFLEMLGITIFYMTSHDVKWCRVWKGDYNIAYQRCEKPTNKKLILFREETK